MATSGLSSGLQPLRRYWTLSQGFVPGVSIPFPARSRLTYLIARRGDRANYLGEVVPGQGVALGLAACARVCSVNLDRGARVLC